MDFDEFVFIFLLLVSILIQRTCSQCDSLVSYSNDGKISIAKSVVSCMQSIDDLLLFPFLQNDNVLTVKSYVILNNLINIDSITNVVTLDFFWRVMWADPRFDMPALFSALNSSKLTTKGIDITQFVESSDVNQSTQPGLWKPDLFFPDASNVEIGESFLKLFPRGGFVWSRHVTINLVMSSFDYKNYPSDSQVIILRFLSYGYDATYLKIELTNDPVQFFLNYQDSPQFEQNTLWTFDKWDAYVLDQEYATILKSFAIIKLYVSRKPEGIILRLAVPIFILVLLSGCTFWAAIESRVDSTVTLLLAVSALYIVIFQNIPMVGYTTDFDSFSVSMFIMLFLCVIVHQLVYRLRNKDQKWPLRLFIARCIEFMGRILLIPLVCIVYFLTFSEAYSKTTTITTFVVIAASVLYVFIREYSGLKSSASITIRAIVEKADRFDSLSNLELLLLNWFVYSIVSTSLRHHMREKQRKSQGREIAPKLIDDATRNPVGNQESRVRQEASLFAL